jgi:hypothetical protein
LNRIDRTIAGFVALAILGVISVILVREGPDLFQSYVATLVKAIEGSNYVGSAVLANLVFVGVMAALLVGFDVFASVTRAILWFAVWAFRGTPKALENLPIHPPERRWWLILIITFLLSRAAIAVPL